MSNKRWFGWRAWWEGQRIAFLIRIIDRLDRDELDFVIECARLRRDFVTGFGPMW